MHLSLRRANVSFKLKLESKKLNSGKCQVKFFISTEETKNLYGYMLVDAKVTLKEVVTHINGKLQLLQETDFFHHSHLYSVGKTSKKDQNFLIFDA